MTPAAQASAPPISQVERTTARDVDAGDARRAPGSRSPPASPGRWRARQQQMHGDDEHRA